MSGKIYYTWSDYSSDIDYITKILNEDKNVIPYFVSIYRGSIPMGVHLSNIYNTPLSIIKFQTRDGKKDNVPYWLINELPETLGENEYIIVLDDIYDTGATLNAVKTLLSESIDSSKVDYLTIHSNMNAVKETDLNPISLRATNGEWIVYPWEVV